MGYAGGMSAAIKRLVDRAESMNRRLARIKQEAKVSEERVVGSAIGLAAAAAAGYVDGAYDLSERDRGQGDGLQVMGLPATPLAGALLLGLGFSDVVPGSRYCAAAGLGVLSGWAYGQGLKRGAVSQTAMDRHQRYAMGG